MSLSCRPGAVGCWFALLDDAGQCFLQWRKIIKLDPFPLLEAEYRPGIANCSSGGKVRHVGFVATFDKQEDSDIA
jgi:hypothetical protein